MATMIPAEYNPAHPQHSEYSVFQTLQRVLGEDWIVLHNLNYVNPEGLRDGEIDFLICHPEHGIMVLEVKGGAIGYCGGQWVQDGRPLDDPFEQAKKNKFFVLNTLRRSYNPFGLKVVHAVCFTDCYESAGWPLEAGGLVITGNKLPGIRKEIERILNAAPPAPAGGIIPPMPEIIQVLTPTFSGGSKLGERIPEEKRRFEYFTKEMYELLEALENFPQLLFRGCAGSGKTTLAVQKAKMLANQNRTVLLLCYNQLLAKKLQQEVKGYGNITAAAFFEYCISQLGLTEAQLGNYRSDPRLYSQVLPKPMQQNIPRKCLAYDAVIVDEGQDFAKEAWEIIKMLLFDGGVFYVFYDPDQNIFTKGENLPEFPLPPVVLKRNCRNTRKIFQALMPYRTIASTIPDEAPEGKEVRILTGNVPELLTSELNRLTDEEKISLNQVVLIGAHSLNHTSLANWPATQRFHIVDGRGIPVQMEVSYYTYMKFKGCESPVVILIDVDESDPRWDRSGLYTAMSRAANQLIILKKG